MNSNWEKWSGRNKLNGIDEPGIYFLAYSQNNLSGKPFIVIEEIIYIGMTISLNGLRGRLNQFATGMKGKLGIHGGAERVKFKHKDENLFFKDCYVSIHPFPVKNNNNVAECWRIKGECVKHEYVSFAEYYDKFRRLPEFNDQESSKKK